MEQELLTLPEHMSSPPVFSGDCVTRSLVLYVYLSTVVCPFVLFLIAPLISSNSSYISVPSFESITLLLGKEYKLMSYVRRISSSIMKRTIKGSDDQQFHR